MRVRWTASGPTIYAYVENDPLGKTDSEGLASTGMPGNNQAQNKQVDGVCRQLNLSKDQRQQLHREISGCNYGYQEILQIAQDMFCQ